MVNVHRSSPKIQKSKSLSSSPLTVFDGYEMADMIRGVMTRTDTTIVADIAAHMETTRISGTHYLNLKSTDLQRLSRNNAQVLKELQDLQQIPPDAIPFVLDTFFHNLSLAWVFPELKNSIRNCRLPSGSESFSRGANSIGIGNEMDHFDNDSSSSTMREPFILDPFDFDDPEAEPTPDLYPTIATTHETSLLPLPPLPPSPLVTDPEASSLLDHSLHLDTSLNSTQEDGPPSVSSNLGDETFDHSLQPDPSANPTLADAPPLASSTLSDLGGDTSVIGENDSNTLEPNTPAYTATIPGPAPNAEEDEPDESELVNPSDSLSAGRLEGDIDDSVFHAQSEGEDDSDGQADDLALSTTFHTTPTPTEDGGLEGDVDVSVFHEQSEGEDDSDGQADDLALSTTTTFHTTPTPTEDRELEGDVDLPAHGHTGSSSAALDEEDTATLLSRTIDSTYMDLISSLTLQSLPLSLVPDLPIDPDFEDFLGSLDPQLSPLLTVPLEPRAVLTSPHSSATTTTDENLEDLAGPSTPARLENQNNLNSEVSEYRQDTGDLEQSDTLSTVTLPPIDVTPPNSPMFEDLVRYIEEISEVNLEQSLYSVQPEPFGGERTLVPPSPEAPQIELLPSNSEDDQSLSHQPVSDPLEHELQTDIIQLQSDPVADPDVPGYDRSTPDTRSSSPLLSDEDDYVNAYTELLHETSSPSNLSITIQPNVQNQDSIRSPTAFERIQSGLLQAIPTFFALNRDSSATG